MRPSLRRLRRRAVPADDVLGRLPLGAGERVLSEAEDLDHTAWLVATNHAFAVLGPDGGLSRRHRWHEVDQGSWQRDNGLLTVTFVDRSRPGQWRLGQERHLLQTLRERVQASVVLTQELTLTGRRTGRAVIRQDLATRELLEQVVLGRGVRAGDPEVGAAVRAALDYLREQVGMPS